MVKNYYNSKTVIGHLTVDNLVLLVQFKSVTNRVEAEINKMNAISENRVTVKSKR